MEVYIYDMVVKNLKKEDSLWHLNKTFQILRHHKMKFNLAKCTFGRLAGKFLGFIITYRGIEPCPNQFRALMDKPSPCTIREIQHFSGKVASLSQFIPRSVKKMSIFLQTPMETWKYLIDHWTWSSFPRTQEVSGLPPSTCQTNPHEKIALVSITRAYGCQHIPSSRRRPKPTFYLLHHPCIMRC